MLSFCQLVEYLRIVAIIQAVKSRRYLRHRYQLGRGPRTRRNELLHLLRLLGRVSCRRVDPGIDVVRARLSGLDQGDLVQV